MHLMQLGPLMPLALPRELPNKSISLARRSVGISWAAAEHKPWHRCSEGPVSALLCQCAIARIVFHARCTCLPCQVPGNPEGHCHYSGACQVPGGPDGHCHCSGACQVPGDQDGAIALMPAFGGSADGLQQAVVDLYQVGGVGPASSVGLVRVGGVDHQSVSDALSRQQTLLAHLGTMRHPRVSLCG